jgi:hypothetical protein
MHTNGKDHRRSAMMERHLHPSPDELQHQESYTLEEAADLLLISINVMRHAVFTGELPARIVGHHIVSLSRQEVLLWFLTYQESHHA